MALAPLQHCDVVFLGRICDALEEVFIAASVLGPN